MGENLVQRALGHDDDDENRLPDHERDTDTTVGGGLMGSGTTATDRGTGELTGSAQGSGDAEDDGSVLDDHVDGVTGGMTAGAPTGGPQPYAPAFVEPEDADTDRDSGAMPDA